MFLLFLFSPFCAFTWLKEFPKKKKRRKKKKIAGVFESNGVVGKTSKPCLGKERGTLDFGSLAGINCGVAKTDIVSVEGVRFAGDADLKTGREMTC